MINWLFLRGAVPTDRDPKEIIHDSLAEDDDMWMHFFAELCRGNYGQVKYLCDSNFNQLKQSYAKDFDITLDSIDISYFVPFSEYDYVFARGGFNYYSPILSSCQYAHKIYYGAGKRFFPTDEIKYDLVLVDTPEQKIECEKRTGMRTELFIKPAAPLFKPMVADKEYDICYVANGPQARFKGIEWVYNTVPSHLKVLHLGLLSAYNPPSNVTCKRVPRWEMPREMAKCKLGIVPYSEVDSCPRVIPEMFACNLPVLVSEETRYWKDKYPCAIANRDIFWKVAESMCKFDHGMENYNYYQNNLTVKHAAERVKGLFYGSSL